MSLEKKFIITGSCEGNNFSGDVEVTQKNLSGVIRPLGRVYGAVYQEKGHTGILFMTIPIFLPATAYFFMGKHASRIIPGEYETFVQPMPIDEEKKARLLHFYEVSSLHLLTRFINTRSEKTVLCLTPLNVYAS